MRMRILALLGLLFTSACLPYSTAENTNCIADQPAQELLSMGAKDKDVWVTALAKVRPRFGVIVFLDNWKSGENYELISVDCSENSAPHDYAYVDFLAPRIGRVEMFVEIVDGALFAHSISLVDVYEEEI